MSNENKIRCGHCGVTYYSAWGSTHVKALSPISPDSSLMVGTILGATCPECNEPTLQYQDGLLAMDAKRVTVYPTQADITLEVVLTIVIEFESFRKERKDGQGLSEEEKQEYRSRPDMREQARQWVSMATAGAAGSGIGQAIAGLLGIA